jgi:hypothetical protein
VRRAVCRSLVSLMETHPDALLPQIEQIIGYMLHSTSESALEVRAPEREREGGERGHVGTDVQTILTGLRNAGGAGGV